ncbi:glucose-1-phosphate adenylyltransferase subunit GlgD [Clostridium sp. AF19-22AC]|jgi:glucose-1-phosphate adenylyltransferase|uniref:Glucose-1-phosphate adenylyltransferase n=1 Tax=Faecalicatena orotica TaxID=1544 RepID=A0A2Y9BHU6_9FIRM|nr:MULTISPECIES: glucose-1-phosphate adenylyltransferase subunit GlgD [Clostridia]PWJ30261.1 glucose-1-phosphate adenylyltransferase [Faecalicatena orotica]RHR30671.1 glucose-1-phosphate adenylyltransferase subunit GlgD [Clostridium sp. AF19-22AC]SSA55250.1 glucose-1-phosphate adenylyltransferase [Faecalicatena orotica]
MNNAFGIVNPSGNHIWVEGLQTYRSIGAFSFLGRYRVIDFPISNMSNSGIDQIQVYLRNKPRSLVDHLGTGRHYNINSKRGKLRVLFSESSSENDIYNTDIAAFMENIECIERVQYPYVVIVPGYMVYTQNFDHLVQTHIDSGADITLLYHSTDNAKENFLNCDLLNLNRQKGVLSIEKNRGTAKNRNIFMDTYVMKKELFIELIHKAKNLSSMYRLAQIVNNQCGELDIRAVPHRGFFASITDFKSYYEANLSLIDFKYASTLFDDEWPIYTRTNDSCPTQYYDTADVRSSVVSNGCLIEGTIENSVIGRGCNVHKGAVVKNSILMPGAIIGKDVHVENQVVDKGAHVLHAKEVIASPEKPGYIRRGDTL